MGKGLVRALSLLCGTLVPFASSAIAEESFRRGDSNSDGKTDLSDAVHTLRFLFLGDFDPACKDASDSNDDGKLDLSDAVYILRFLFLGEREPPPPSGSCGLDLTGDALSCRSYSPCSAEAFSHLIGSEGGLLEVDDPGSELLGLKVVFPAGAFEEETAVTLSTTRAPQEVDLESFILATRPFHLQAGAPLEKPIRLVIPYADADDDALVDRAQVPEETLLVLGLFLDADEPEELPLLAIDAEENTLTATASGLGTFTVLGSPASGGSPEVHFLESWESAPAGSLSPAVTFSFRSDEGVWGLLDTVSEFPEDCGATPHRAEVIPRDGGQALRLRSNVTDAGCADNISVAYFTSADVPVLGNGKEIPITRGTALSFEEEGELTDPAPGLPGCVFPPCGDNVSLHIEDNRGNHVVYVLQRAPGAVPRTIWTFYTKFFLDSRGGRFARDLFADFSTLSSFDPVGAVVSFIEFRVDEHGSAILDDLSISAGASVIRVEVVDQDDPANEEFTLLGAARPIVYGGSKNSTADDLRLTVEPDAAGPPVQAYSWSVLGTGAENYTPPPASPAASEWLVGRVMPISSILIFEVELRFEGGGSKVLRREIEVGVRTDHVAAVAWIDPQRVTPLTDGVKGGILSDLPPDGPGGFTPGQALVAGITILAVARGEYTPPATPADKAYVLNWLFKYSANDCKEALCPPASFNDAMDLEDFRNEKKTSYKLVNQFQIKYRLSPVTGEMLSEIIRPSVADGTGIGTTASISPFGVLEFPGRPGGFNNSRITDEDAVSVINEGSPDEAAVAVFNGLMSPLSWSDIGSIIRFSKENGTSADVCVQVYPTYSIYISDADSPRLMRIRTIEQAPSPTDNFSADPYYPFDPTYASGPAPFLPETLGNCTLVP